MPSRIGPLDGQYILKFGGGVNSRASEEDIDDRECSDGANFDLDLSNLTLRNRKPFDLVATAPNGGRIRGFVTLKKTDGAAQLAIQAGDTVYEWDGTSLTSIATVSSSADLRGRIEHNWNLDDKVLVTDLSSQEEVIEWDGTTWQDIAFTKDVGSGPVAFGDFKAKYCFIRDERAFYANVIDPSSTTPHLLVGSKRGDYDLISVADRPSSSIALDDPFFLIQPDYHPINGMIAAFGRIMTSSDAGALFYLDGDSSQDFNFKELHPRSGAAGDEAIAFVGNDAFVGLPGRISSVGATDKFGNADQFDPTVKIADKIESVDDWTFAYNDRTQRLFAYPDNGNVLYVMHSQLLDSRVSPWSIYTTNLPAGLNPTAMMPIIDPADGLEYVFWGDTNGNIYRMEGTGAAGDGGTYDVPVERVSKLITAELDEDQYRIDGWILYRKDLAFSAVITLEFAGTAVRDEEITVSATALTRSVFYSDGNYYSGGVHYGTPFEGRLIRHPFSQSGRSTEFQVRVKVESVNDIELSEVGLRFSKAR